MKVDEGEIGVGVYVGVGVLVLVGHLDVDCLAFVEKGTFWRGHSIVGRKVAGSPLREEGTATFQSLEWVPPC